MKIAISTSGTDLQAPLDQRFGRCAHFLLYDDDSGDFTLVENSQNLNAAQGAGIQAAKTVADSGAQAVISGHCGPKAFKVLDAAGIAVYPCQAASVAEALDLFKSGKLTAAANADVEGHWV